MRPQVRERQEFHWSQILLHWLIAGLVFTQFMTGSSVARIHKPFPIGRGPSAADLFWHTVHIRRGLAILAFMVLRLVLRLGLGAPPPLGPPSSLRTRIAKAMHWTFYAILIIQGVTGAIATYVWWPISRLHVITTKLLLALIAIHAAAALWHLFVERDGTFERMLGFRR